MYNAGVALRDFNFRRSTTFQDTNNSIEKQARIVEPTTWGANSSIPDPLEKEAFVIMGSLATAGALAFSALSAYDLATDVYGAGKDIWNGKYKDAAKRIPALALDGIGIVPGVGVLAKVGKVYKTMKGVAKVAKTMQTANKLKRVGKLRQAGNALKMTWRNGVVKEGSKALAEAKKASGFSMINPLTWFSDSAKAANKAKKISKIENKLNKHVAILQRQGGQYLGNTAMADSKYLEKGLMTGFRTQSHDVRELAALKDQAFDKRWLNRNMLDDISGTVSMIPLGVTLAGAGVSMAGAKDTGRSLMNAGGKIDNFMYYHPENAHPGLPSRTTRDFNNFVGFNNNNNSNFNNNGYIITAPPNYS